MFDTNEEKVSLLEWSRLYEIGVSQVDEQHRELIALTRRLVEAVQQGHGRDIIVEVLQKLAAYTQSHFKDEEAIMERIHYPELEEHRKEHERFIQEVARDVREVLSGTGVPTNRVLKFLSDWLIDHIMVYDRKIGVYMKHKGIQA